MVLARIIYGPSGTLDTLCKQHQESCAPLKLSEADLISLNTSEVTEVP